MFFKALANTHFFVQYNITFKSELENIKVFLFLSKNIS